MKLSISSPKKALKPFLKQKPLRSEIDLFKKNLIVLLDKISIIEQRPKDESEEHLKNDLRDFLRDTFYNETNAINTKDKKDLVIHLEKTTDSEVGVIIEAKRPANVSEMISAENPNKKALHELILYYLKERNNAENFKLKQLIITNINEWYIIDANFFDKHIFRNTEVKKLYDTKQNDRKDNPFFYEEIAKIIQKSDVEIPCIYFNIKDYDTILRNNNAEDDKELIALFKILSPQHLLKIASPNDSNSLDERFYRELLHIIGLEEAKEGAKNIIRRVKDKPNSASLLELAIDAIKTEDTLHRIPDQSVYGTAKDERIFNIALELCITWINRILFLKLLEGQLITYHRDKEKFSFLNIEKIHDFDELFKLFHKVLAVNVNDRTDAIKIKYANVPYLNSSLFEISELEDQIVKINSLDNSEQLALIGSTILKDTKKETAKLRTLEYLFKFLDAYDFASEGTSDIQENEKKLINASVLGKVFEKINGYKDGSIYTPAFITMYMSRESIRLAVVEKFNQAKQWNITKFEEIYDRIKDRKEANEIINSIKICDPAVGSGHFLVSALNEIIAIKSELNILIDENGKTLRDYEIEIINDELIVTDENANIFSYNYKNKESNRVQKTLFHEKQTIIENCLFGVDINPNSVKICRLRLWIELLKNAYYRIPPVVTGHVLLLQMELETLPNIDINIKTGNSLLSRFPLDADLSKALKSIKYDIKAYRGFVSDYKNEKNRDTKRGLQKIIDTIKSDFRTEIYKNDPKQVKLNKLGGELFSLLNQGQMFEQTDKEKKAQKDKQQKIETEINKLSQEIEDIKSNAIYKNAFEWRFEFPEVLSNEGEFTGFDLVIGNPPYIDHKKLSSISGFLKERYKVYFSSADISSYFFELGNNILNTNGYLTLISTNKFFRTEYGMPLRKFISEHKIYSIINFEQVPIFDEVLVSSLIILLGKVKLKSDFSFCEFSKEPSPFKDFENLVNRKQVSISSDNFGESSWAFSNDSTSKIIEKLMNEGNKIKNIKSIDIKRGVTTGYDPAFIISEDIAHKLINSNSNNKLLIKSLLKGKDIKPYKTITNQQSLICIPKGYTIKSNNTENYTGIVSEPMPRYGFMEFNEANDYFFKKHKEILNYLKKFYTEADKRTDQGDFWWELRACDYYDYFEKEKIVWPLTADKWGFAIDTEKHYLSSGGFMLISESLNLKYLLAVLNSQLMKFLFSQIGVMTAGGAFTLKKATIEEFPIQEISSKEQLPFINLVETIISQKQKGEDSTANERKIDEMVYKLYDLTEEEIGIVEGK